MERKARVTRTALCTGQVIKKKGTVSRPKCNAGNGPRWRLKDTPTAAIFAAKVQISTSESGPKWRFRTRKAATTFFAVYAPIWSLFSFKYRMSIILSLRNEHCT
jgi:hypothetical protein